MTNISPITAIWMAWFITALNLVVCKIAVPYISSPLFIFISCALSVVCFLPYLLKTGHWRTLCDKKVWPACLAMGTFGTALPMTIFLFALRFTTPTNAAILNQFEIIYSLILTAILLKERPTLRQLLGSALIVSGVILILWQAGLSLQLKGDLLIIGCVWMYQISHIFAKKLPPQLPPALIAAARALFALPALAVLLFVLRIGQGPLLFSSNWTVWGILLFSAIANYTLGNTWWYHAIRNMDLSKATAIILSYPVMTCLLSLLFRQDSFSYFKLGGMLLAIGGAYIVTCAARKGENS